MVTRIRKKKLKKTGCIWINHKLFVLFRNEYLTIRTTNPTVTNTIENICDTVPINPQQPMVSVKMDNTKAGIKIRLFITMEV